MFCTLHSLIVPLSTIYMSIQLNQFPLYLVCVYESGYTEGTNHRSLVLDKCLQQFMSLGHSMVVVVCCFPNWWDGLSWSLKLDFKAYVPVYIGLYIEQNQWSGMSQLHSHRYAFSPSYYVAYALNLEKVLHRCMG